MPPYTDPHQAVRTGMDFLVNMGDSWLSNTPRRGAVSLRTTMQHSETQLCIACHPAQFTTRGYLTAVQKGYAPTQRSALEFLTDRIYNNARPLYGEANTNWVRVIYSARTVASRLPVITSASSRMLRMTRRGRTSTTVRRVPEDPLQRRDYHARQRDRRLRTGC